MMLIGVPRSPYPFTDILKEYRRLDDTIIMRLNRANALARDAERGRHGEAGGDNAQNQACVAVFRELVGASHVSYLLSRSSHLLENWKRRTKLVDYCVSVADRSLDQKREAFANNPPSDPSSQRKAQAEIFAQEVHVSCNASLTIVGSPSLTAGAWRFTRGINFTMNSRLNQLFANESRMVRPPHVILPFLFH